jgi:hypothetical protein
MVCTVDRLYKDRYRDSISPKAYYMLQAASCVTMLPENAEMPQRTEEALRVAGLYDDSEVGDADHVRSLIVQKLTPADFVPAAIPVEKKAE